MKPRWSGRSGLLQWLFPLLWLLAVATLAKDDEPKVKMNKFEHQLSDVAFFEDSEVVLATDRIQGASFRSTDAGATWKPIEELEGTPLKIYMNPNNNKVAVALSEKGKHWISKDQGKEWRKFTLEEEPDFTSGAISFHSSDSDKIIINTDARYAKGAYYTTNGFESDPKRFKEKTVRCIWAKEQPLFDERTKDKKVSDGRVICVILGKYSSNQEDFRLVVTDNYFDSMKEPELENGRTVPGIVNMVAVKGFICAARLSVATNEMALYTTTDSIKWGRATFGGEELKAGGYTIMESTNYSLQVDVAVGQRDNQMGAKPMGMLYTSNSDGLKFTPNEEYTNRNELNYADFEKLQNIQGVVIVNHVENYREVMKNLDPKRLVTRISFDDGRSFQALKTDKGSDLHLHSITDQSNVGRIFSSPAPGVVMGVGNTGDYLSDYRDGDTCVSDDAGLTWTCPLKGPHKYEFGDQGSILLAISDDQASAGTKEIKFSYDHGKEWKTFKFEEEEVRPTMLTTVPDSTSLKFLLQAAKGRGMDAKHSIYAFDFEDVGVRKCEEKDFEKWYVRQGGDDKKQSCVMGHKQSFRRRKPDSVCFVKSEFREPLADRSEVCGCTKNDFECDEGFFKDAKTKECSPSASFRPPEGACKSSDDKFKGDSGYRLIPGNTCDRKDGPKLDEPKEWKCDQAKQPSNGKPSSEGTTFPAGGFVEYYYLETPGGKDGDPETVVVLTDQRKAYLSQNQGKHWEPLFDGEEIRAIYPNRLASKEVYFLTSSEKVHYSRDRGKTFGSFKAPSIPNTLGLLALRFHPSDPNWLIWTGCDPDASRECEPMAHASLKGGSEWTVLGKLVENCEFVWEKTHRPDVNKKRILCVKRESMLRDATKQLLASDDLFESRDVIFDDVLNFATMSEYIIVARVAKNEGDDNKYLKVDASVDAATFADAKFPPNVEVPHQTAYTVLDSSTHAIFLHVTTYGVKDQEFGTIFKSNSNGTSYVMSIPAVNRNFNGYVDFEKMTGLEGVALVNIVANEKEVREGRVKKLQTRITHSDGAYWDPIIAPEKDSEGNDYDCKNKDKCKLHLHGYTERRDPRDTFSSESAIGVMIGIGNVGEYLGRRQEGDTFMSTDGGISWKSIKKGQYMWEFGDQGAVITIVKEREPTRAVYYSKDEGETWQEYVFSDHDMLIYDITTVPSDTSRNFVLWGMDGKDAITINLDFSGLTDRKCKLDEEHPFRDDYKMWIPEHPRLDEHRCLFGHVTEYLRKKPSKDCYNGLPQLKRPWHIRRNCSCSLADFECDYNYERVPGGDCKQVKGLSPKDHQAVCKDPKVTEWYEPTGYRKIPLSTCQGGRDLTGKAHPCPGHEEEFRERHGISAVGLFFAIVLPIAAACGIGYWVYRNYEGRFGLGRIRLEGGGSSSRGEPKDWLKWPVAIVSGAAAVAMAIPMVLGSVYRSVRERFGHGSWHSQRSRAGYGGVSRPYTSRSSFARPRGDYAAVGANDESDLLGEDDSDDDV